MDKLNRLLFLGPVISRLPEVHCQRTSPRAPLSGDKLLIKWTVPGPPAAPRRRPPSSQITQSRITGTLLYKCKCSTAGLENPDERGC